MMKPVELGELPAAAVLTANPQAYNPGVMLELRGMVNNFSPAMAVLDRVPVAPPNPQVNDIPVWDKLMEKLPEAHVSIRVEFVVLFE